MCLKVSQNIRGVSTEPRLSGSLSNSLNITFTTSESYDDVKASDSCIHFGIRSKKSRTILPSCRWTSCNCWKMEGLYFNLSDKLRFLRQVYKRIFSTNKGLMRFLNHYTTWLLKFGKILLGNKFLLEKSC